MDAQRPLFIPVVLGTTRRGRMSAAAATLMVREIGNRRNVATELIDIATVPMPVDDAVFGQALFHATANLAWQLFPNAGSHYNPAITGPILSIAAALVTGRGWLQGRPPPARG